ncbi:MAG: TIGR04283 family arsenosugar biosynthesis glycosyltransferase [Gammaproteobacteria bacterium]
MATQHIMPEADVSEGVLLSVIVPLAPGETEAEVLLEQLTALPVGSELIVVRAEDQPESRPANWPAKLAYREYTNAAGRARQLNLGARVARGYWLWFLHADSRLLEATLPALQGFITGPDEALGWFDLQFRHDGPRLVVLNAMGANLRAHWLGMPFGDQGLVLPKSRFETIGGFDEDAAYGEDHLLVWAARRSGLPLRPVGAPLQTSARKYTRRGWLATTVTHWCLTVAQAWPEWRRNRRTPS